MQLAEDAIDLRVKNLDDDKKSFSLKISPSASIETLKRAIVFKTKEVFQLDLGSIEKSSEFGNLTHTVSDLLARNV